MSVWLWYVTVDGIQLPNVVNNVSAQLGTNNPLDQAVPGTCSLIVEGLPVVNGVTQNPDWYLGKTLSIFVTHAVSGALAHVFYGEVLSQTTTALDVRATQVTTELSGQSFLGRLSQIPLEGVAFTAETEYERVYGLFDRQVSQTWAQLPSTMTWANIPEFFTSDPTWAEFAVSESSAVPLLRVPNWTPGDPDPSLQLEAVESATGDLLNYTVEMAMGAGGFIYENLLGIPEYDYLTRADLTSAPSKTINLAPAAVAFSMDDTSALWDVYTEATVSNSTLTATDANFPAMQTYGPRLLEITSPLALENDLQTLATTKVAALSRPLPNLTTITVDYGQLATADRRWICGGMLTLTGIPAVFGGDGDYQIRGLNFRGTKDLLEVDWTVLPRRSLFPGPMWRNLSPTLIWNDITTTWNDWE